MNYNSADVDADESIPPEQENSSWENKDAVLFIIDASPSMLIPSPDNDEIPFLAAVKAASITYQNKIISSENDFVGVIFYNTKISKNPSGFEHIYLLQDLDLPDAPKILQLETIFKNGIEKFSLEYGSSTDEFPFGNVFWTAANVFSSSKAAKAGSKRLFLFTNEDHPHRDNLILETGAKTRAKDLFDLGISLELFHLDKPNDPFDFSAFYEGILDLQGFHVGDAEDENSSSFEKVSTKLSELMTRIRRKETKKRALMRIPLNFGSQANDSNPFQIGIKMFILYTSMKKGTYVFLDPKTNEPVKSSTEWIDENTGSTLIPSDFQYCYMFGGEKAIFSKEELKSIQTSDETDDLPGLKIIGFKPASCLKLYHNITHSYFVYPDESAYRGSTLVFSALLNRLLATDKIAICKLIARQSSGPKLVALVPQPCELDHDNVQVKSPGFNMIVLPFADDIRHPVVASSHSHFASPSQVDLAKEILSKLTIKSGYSPDDYENPILQKHYINLQALALDQDTPDEIIDKTQPDFDKIDKRIGSLAKSLLDSLPSVSSTSSSLVKTSKRKASAPTSATTNKKATKTILDDMEIAAEDVEYFKSIVNDDSKLHKCTVAKLKSFLESAGVSKLPKLKVDLIDEVKKYFQV